MASQLNTEKLSDMVKSKRGSRGLRDLAKEIGEISASTLSRIEQGNLPDIDTFFLICKWLEVSPEFFNQNDSPTTLADSSEIIVAHLRADRTLKPEIAESLINMVTLAYQSASKDDKGAKK